MDRYTIKNGYPDENAFNIIQDSLGYLWISSNRGLIRFAQVVQLESIAIGDTLFRPHPSGASIYRFPHDHNNPELRYIGLEYTQPQKIAYAYKMLGIDSDWIMNGHNQVTRYTRLEPGHYNFLVKAANREGTWSHPKSEKFTIVPPWWATTTARIGYLMSALLLLLAVRSNELRRKLSEVEAKRLLELDSLKSKLYSNITHEFRTPLTVILGLADQLQEKVNESGKEGLQMIQRNGNRLLNLVKQMLDLQKLEAGAMSVNETQGDMIQFLKYLVESFHSYAESKNIRLQFSAGKDALFMDFDPEKIQDIFSNLVSNALKFTPSGGLIDITCETVLNKQFRIAVRDTGIGIPAEKLPKIFDRFYQADDSSVRRAEGAGIGLALTRELVQLLAGEISVTSVFGSGSEFTVLLPIHQTAPLFTEPMTGHAPEQTFMDGFIPSRIQEPSPSNGLPQLLIIEDNQDVVKYLHAVLQEDYQLQTAPDGVEGIDHARGNIPDLIISDVMMPRMDGYQVCNILKQDTRTSHIPLILLTAKADMDSKLEGLQYGADVYLIKPFIKEELLTHIRSLLDQKERLYAHYRQLYGVGKESTDPAEGISTISEPENEFIQKVQRVIFDHLDDSMFSVGQLCHAMVMSNSQLYRKLKAHTGLSAHDLIQSVRLSHAQILLKKTEDTIVSIAYTCGFNDPEYFSRVFKKEFGFSPSEYRNR